MAEVFPKACPSVTLTFLFMHTAIINLLFSNNKAKGDFFPGTIDY